MIHVLVKYQTVLLIKVILYNYLFWIVVGKTRVKMRPSFGETPKSPFDKGHILQIVNVIDQ